MCLLIVKPPTATIPREHIIEGFQWNSDGGGFAVADGKQLLVSKGYKTGAALADAFEASTRNLPAILHCRMATHGSKTEENCHPFMIGENWAMAHNGILSNVPMQDDESDTRAFVRWCLVPWHVKHGIEFDQPHVIEEVEKLSVGSKLAFLSKDGRIAIAGEKAGHWSDGVWYSNASYKSGIWSCTPKTIGKGWRSSKAEEEDESEFWLRGRWDSNDQITLDRRTECDCCGSKLGIAWVDIREKIVLCESCAPGNIGNY
jgi:glutamine amidotransferase